MASFTRDFTVAEEIHREQMAVLAEAGAQPGWCTSEHAAKIVMGFRSYVRNRASHPTPFYTARTLSGLGESYRVGTLPSIGDENRAQRQRPRSNLFLRSHLRTFDSRHAAFAPCCLLQKPLGYVVEFDWRSNPSIERPPLSSQCCGQPRASRRKFVVGIVFLGASPGRHRLSSVMWRRAPYRPMHDKLNIPNAIVLILACCHGISICRGRIRDVARYGGWVYRA